MTNNEQISKQKVKDENLLRKRQKEEDDSDEEFFCVKVKKRKSMKDTKSDCNNKVRDVNCDEKNNFDSNGDSLDNDDFSSDYYQIEKNISEDDHNFQKLHGNQIIEVDVDDVKKNGKKNGVSVTKKNKDDEITNMDDKLFQWVKQYYYGNRVRKAITYPTTIQSSYTTLPLSSTILSSSSSSSSSTSSSSSSYPCNSSTSSSSHAGKNEIFKCQNGTHENTDWQKNSQDDNFLDLSDSVEILIKEDIGIDFEKRENEKKATIDKNKDVKKEDYPDDVILPLFFQHQGHSRTIIGKGNLFPCNDSYSY